MGARGANHTGPQSESTIRLGDRKRAQIARLMQLHHQFHPERLARKLGLSRVYVANLWARLPAREQASDEEALALYRTLKP